MTPPGWHPDPSRRADWRWWDGTRWTPTVAIGGWVMQEGGTPPGQGGGAAPGHAGVGPPGHGGVAGGSSVVETGPRRAPWPTLPTRALWFAAGGFVGGAIAASIAAGVCISLGYGTYDPITVVADLVALWTFLGGAAFLASRRYGSGDLRRDYGVGFAPFDVLRGAGASLVGRFAVSLVTVIILDLAQHGVTGNTQIIQSQRGHTLDLLIVGAGAVIGAPIFEELFFRGLVLRTLAGRFPYGWAVAMQGTLFGLAHAQVGMGGLTLIATIAGTATFGMVQGYFAARWRLGALMVSHALFNLVAVVAVAALVR